MSNRNEVLGKYYEDNYDELKKRAYFRLKDDGLAEDAVQEAFCRALKFYDEDRIKSFGGWFTTILNNACKDIHREEVRKGVTLEFNEELNEGLEDLNLEAQEVKKIVSLIESKRSVNERNVLHMYFLQNHMPRDIVQTVDLSYSRVRNCISEFRKQCKETFGY